jgi:hypothetical protein
MELAFLAIIFAGIFIAPLVLGAYILAEDANMGTLNAWFGFAILIFVGVAALGTLFLFTQKLPI